MIHRRVDHYTTVYSRPKAIQYRDCPRPANGSRLQANHHHFYNWIFIDEGLFSLVSVSVLLKWFLTVEDWWPSLMMTRENKGRHVAMLSANISKWWQIRLKIRPSRALSPDDGWLTGEFCFSDCDDILLQLHSVFCSRELYDNGIFPFTGEDSVSNERYANKVLNLMSS